MSLLRRRRHGDEERSINLSAYAGLWADSYAGFSPVGVSTATALSHAASSACIDTLATSVSALPVDVIRQVGDRRQEVRPTPTLIAQPSQLVEQDVWFYQAMQSMLTDGNVFAEVSSFTSGGFPASLDLIDPATVGERRVDNGVPTARVAGEVRALYPFGDVWHVPGRFVTPGSPFAESPVQRARSTIGSAVAARDFGSKFFADGGHPGALIRSESELTKEQAQALKDSFRNAIAGNRQPMVMGSGLNYEPIMVDPNDSQFIELMQFCVEEACRFWRVPPSMVYGASSGQNVTYANVSQADLAYLKHSLEGHLVRLERALTRLLPRPQFVRFNRTAFLRSDPVTRSEVVDRRLRNGTLTVNEARALEDEPPFPGDEYNQPGIPAGLTPAPTTIEGGVDA